jgi:hypothetical protein
MLYSWILILLFTNTSGSAITSQRVEGFTSRQACMEEGSKVLTVGNVRYQCIQKR